MTPEQEEIIETMALAFWSTQSRGLDWQMLTEAERSLVKSRLCAALRVARDRGWELSKPPSRIGHLSQVPHGVQDSTMGSCRAAYLHGVNETIDAIETLKLDEGESE